MKTEIYLFLFFCFFSSYADIPTFNQIGPIKNGAEPISCAYASPSMVDWDHDGITDILLGEFVIGDPLGGKIRFYKNRGSNNSPVFSDFVFIKAGGKDIAVTAG